MLLLHGLPEQHPAYKHPILPIALAIAKDTNIFFIEKQSYSNKRTIGKVARTDAIVY
jgi:hypothetical protein